MKNTHSSHKRDMIMICKDMDITGIISVTDNVINLGYNEQIFLETEEQALMLFKIIQGIIVKGIEAENVIDNMMDAMKTIFFQDQLSNTTI